MPLDYGTHWRDIAMELSHPLYFSSSCPYIVVISKNWFSQSKQLKVRLWLNSKDRKINLTDLGYNKTNFHNSPWSKWQVPFSPMAEGHILTMVSTQAACSEASVGDVTWEILLKDATCFPTCHFVKKVSHRKKEKTQTLIAIDKSTNVIWGWGVTFLSPLVEVSEHIHVLGPWSTGCLGNQILSLRPNQSNKKKKNGGSPQSSSQCTFTHMCIYIHTAQELTQMWWEQKMNWLCRQRN